MNEPKNPEFQVDPHLGKQVDHLLTKYVKNPQSPQPEEVQRMAVDLLSHQNELAAEVRERRDVQKRLEAYRDRYVDLYDFAPVGYVTFDEEGYIQEINLAGAKLLGRELPELVGYPFMDHVVVPDRAAFLQHIQKCCGEQQDATSELSLIAKDGRLIAAHLRSVPIADIEHEGTFCKTAITDITELKRAEQALRESEHRLRFALDGIEAGKWDLNLADHTAYRSLQHDRIFGYETLLPQWTYEMFLEHVVPEDRQFVDQKFGQAIEARCAWDFECRIIRCDHSMRWIWARGRPVLDENGKPTHLVGIVQDITTRKQAEEAIRKSEAQARACATELSAVMEAVPAIIFLANDPQCQRMTGNRATRQLLRISEGLSVSKSAPESQRPTNFRLLKDGRELVTEELPVQIAASTGREVRDTELTLAFDDGTHKDIFGNAVPLFDDSGKTRGAVAAFVDITERKRVEEELRRSEARLNLSQKIAHLGSWELDLVHNRLTWSDEVYRIFGLEPQEFGATYEAFLDRVHPDDRAAVDAAYAGSVREGRNTYEIEHRVVRHDTGEVRVVHERCEHFCDTTGRIVRSLGMVQDITDRQRTEELLKKAHDELEQRVEERTRELTKANEKLAYLASFPERNPHPIIEVGLSGDIRYVNAAAQRLFPELRVQGQKHPWLGNWEAVVRQLGEGRAETAIREVAVGDRWYQQSFYCDVRDQVARIYGLDITERKQAEEALQRSEERLRLAQHVAQVGTFEWNIQTGLNNWTPELESMYGLPPGGFPETQPAWENLLHRDDRPEAIRLVERALETGEPVEGEWRVVWPDSSVHWLAGRFQAFKGESGKPQRMIGVNIDITKRKQADEALRASEERYDLAVRGAGTGIWDYDVRTGKVYYSPRWKAMFGFGEHDIDDTLEDWIRLLHPDERDWIIKFQEDFLAGTELTVTVEYRLRHKDGSYRWIVAHGLAVRDEHGKAYRLVGSHGDITDRKRTEDALAREHRTLKHLLQASDHERQVIAYEIHDGLAQELAGAIMQFQVFDHAKDTKPKDAANAFHAGMTMLQQSHLDARRLISGVRPPILDEAGIVAAVSHLVNEERRQKGPKIEYLSKVEFERLTPILENAIYRIIQEALTNVCRHSKSKKVHVELIQCGDQLRIEVRDRGVGFRPEDVGESRFGLEGIRERARLLGGKATIETELGQGTKVVVVLPIVLRRPEDEQSEESDERWSDDEQPVEDE